RVGDWAEWRGCEHAGVAVVRYLWADLRRRPSSSLQELAEEGPEPVAHIGHEEIERVEREQRRHHLDPPFGPAHFEPTAYGGRRSFFPSAIVDNTMSGTRRPSRSAILIMAKLLPSAVAEETPSRHQARRP